MVVVRTLAVASITLATAVTRAQHPGIIHIDSRPHAPGVGGIHDRVGPIISDRTRGVSVGDLDELWVGGWNTHNLARIDLNSGELIEMFVPTGVGGLRRAHAFSFGPRGNLYVTSYSTDQVLRYDGQTGRFIDEFIGPGNGLLRSHTAFWNADGTMIVSSEQGDRVNQYDGITGEFVRAIVEPGQAGLDGPEIIAEGPDGFLYLATQSNQVLRIDPINGGATAFVEDDPATPDIDESGGMSWGHGITFGPDGNLYVASSNTNSVLRFDGTTGVFSGAFIPPGLGGLQFPIGIAFNTDGTLYVASFGNSRILRYDENGQFLGTLVNLGPLGLSGPLDIKLLAGPVCKADTTGAGNPDDPGYGVPNGTVDADDFFYFLDQFAARNGDRADLTGSGNPNSPLYGVPNGTVDADDFFYFLDMFADGC